MAVASSTRPRAALSWQSFEAWVGTRSSAAALFVLSLAVFAVQSAVLPAYAGRDMVRYAETYVQLPYQHVILPSVMNTRGPLAALGTGLPLELGGAAAEIWLALLYAASILAWGYVGLTFGKRAAILTSGLLLVYPGYGILFHGLAGDSLFAAVFAGWALLLTRAMLRPSVAAFALAGFGMGALVLVRPSNQVLVVVALVPLVVRGSWGDRLRWVASFFVASVVLTQGWKAFATTRYGDGLGMQPSKAVVAVAALLLVLVALPVRWRRWAALAAIPVAIGALVVAGGGGRSPLAYARTIAQIPEGNQFLFRAYEMDRIMSPSNGPASRQLAQVVQRDLLTKEPYRSYGIDVHTFFSAGSDRMYGDLVSLPGVDLGAATTEAIRRHPWKLTAGIVGTAWNMLFVKRVYAPENSAQTDSRSSESAPTSGSGSAEYVVVDGRKLPRPSDGQPIPSSRVGPVIWTTGGAARQVWRSATRYSLVFDHALDARRWATFNRDTDRLTARIPTRSANQLLVHRLNQTSHVFPPPGFWLALGLVALLVRRPRRSLVALAPTFAALVVILATSLVAYAVAEYAAPVSAAFLLLTAVGLVGAEPRGRVRFRSRGGPAAAGGG